MSWFFPYGLYAGSALAAGAATWAGMFFWSRWCRRAGLVAVPGGRRIHRESTPLSGGLAILCGMFLPLAMGALASAAGWAPASLLGPMTHGFAARGGQVAAFLGGAVAMTILGAADDRREMRAGGKFLAQVAISLAVAASGVRLTLFVDNAVFSYGVTVLWILSVINAFNFLDNMNGLCGGLGFLAALFFGLGAAAQGHYLVAALAFTAAGAVLGFLPHNFPDARAFLGDSGSHLVGYVLAVLAILPHYYTGPDGPRWAVLKPLLILAVPLADMAAVIVLRTRMGKPFYVGDTNHISHRLTRRGWSRRSAVMLIWLAAAAIGAASFLF